VVTFDDLAIVYTSTEVGHGHTPMAFMNLQVAMAYCSDDRTKGKRYGYQWATFWQLVGNYFGDGWYQTDDLRKIIDTIRDDGRFPEYERVTNDEALRIIADRLAHDRHEAKVAAAMAPAPMQDSLFEVAS